MMHYEPVMDYWNEELSTAETGDMVLCSTGSLDWFVMLEWRNQVWYIYSGYLSDIPATNNPPMPTG